MSLNLDSIPIFSYFIPFIFTFISYFLKPKKKKKKKKKKKNIITKTYLYNLTSLNPTFYVVKLGFTGVYIIFLISAQNIDCGYSLGPPRRGGSNEYPQSMF